MLTFPTEEGRHSRMRPTRRPAGPTRLMGMQPGIIAYAKFMFFGLPNENLIEIAYKEPIWWPWGFDVTGRVVRAFVINDIKDDGRFENWATWFILICQCLSEEIETFRI